MRRIEEQLETPASLTPRQRGVLCVVASAILCGLAITMPDPITITRIVIPFAAGLLYGRGQDYFDEARRDDPRHAG